eukprot:IDg909t1
MRLFRSRTRVRDKNGAFKDGPPLRSMGAVEVLRHLPKFGCGSPTAVGNDGTGTTHQSLMVMIWSMAIKSSSQQPNAFDRIAGKAFFPDSIHAMKEKNSMKRSELRFKRINALPDGDEKTK